MGIFESYRVNGRIDIDKAMSDGVIVYNEDEQRGARENKFWFNDYGFMYKDVYAKTYEDYAELLAYEFASLFGIPCAEYDMASYNGNRGVITKSVVDEMKGEEMVSGTEIINEVYQQHIKPLLNMHENYTKMLKSYEIENFESYLELSEEKKMLFYKEISDFFEYSNITSKEVDMIKLSRNDNQKRDLIVRALMEIIGEVTTLYNEEFIKTKSGVIKSNNLYDVWNVLDVYCKMNGYKVDSNNELMDDFVNLFLFDIITFQGDRHADNWSIIIDKKDGSIRLSPLYDNSGICSLNREKAIQRMKEYVNQLNNPKLNDRKKDKVNSLIYAMINHSNSAVKVDFDDFADAEEKKKNSDMIEKFISHSSSEFLERLNQMLELLTIEKLEEIYKIVEEKTKTKLPDEVKLITTVAINTNVSMIRECLERRMSDVSRKV